MRTLVLCCIWFYSVAAVQREFFLSASPSDMKVDGDGRVFLAAGNQLLRLDSTLALQENVTLGSSVLRVALSSDERRVVVCLSDLSCAVYNASDFGAGELLRRTGVSVSSDVVALFTAKENSFYVGSVVGGTSLSSMNLGQYGFVESFARSTSYGILRSGFMRTFFGGFVNGTNTYYFMADGRPSNVQGLRVLRACDISTCPIGPCNFDALYELRIDCGGGSLPLNSVICGLSVLDSFADSSDTTVVLARCNRGTSARNRVCSFRLADIDDNMDRKYTQCRQRTGDIQVAWDAGQDRECSSDFQARGVCDFSPPLGDVDAGRSPSDTGLPVVGSVQLEFGDTEITASAAITVDSTSIIYVGYTNSSGNFVGAFYTTTTSPLLPFPGPANSFYTRSISSPVRQLEWESGLDYMYMATESSVLQIPLEECANFTDCESCISYNNPLCGWCTVENKCSRRSQCQNAVEPVRWVQNSSQCISTTITPNQFVLDDSEILSVTVTPGLPPLLTNESYQCQFTDRERLRVITVDAEEVTPNTVYQCNITGRIPTFTGVQLVTDFSFVSSRAGIPFATNMGALTVTRCESATSCSQCLQTDNACGWCIYNKVCSGTPAPCTNETNWLQLNGTNITYRDVCPLLGPSSFTPSGDYVQPVNVARDIELQTRNLPPPISGFRYVCSLGGTVTLPAVYNNESSLTCRVNQNQISSSSSTENITISIVWETTSSGRQHPIDLLTPVNMVLYNCPSLADGCSSCLGANLGTGFDCGWCSGSSDDMCHVSEDCRSPAQFATAPNECPAATITSVLPTSGPPEGGTTVTITGTDLGVTYDDIVNNVMISSSPCITQEDDYIPGTQIVCETTAFTSGPGPKDVIVTVLRGTGSPLVVRGMFTVVAPTVTGVEPSLGPMSGGTTITIRGSGLNISNVEDTRVTLDGVNGPECTIQMQSISGTEIRCDSTAYPYNSSLLPSTGSVVVHIGNADVTGAGVEFTFRRDPTFSSVTPRMTIPAGGISLNFTGTELNSVQRPTLVVYDPSASPQRTVCRSVSPTLLVCTAPALSGGVPFSIINYTIIMDNAPGPSSVDLRLRLVPNPRINTSDYTISAGSPITITYNGVVDLMLFRSEIRVLVGGVPCNIINVDSGTIVCAPPSQAPGGVSEATVIVMIGTNFNFTVGTLTYTTTPLNLQLIIPVTVGPVALVLLLSMLVICIIVSVTRSSARAKDKHLTTLLSQMEHSRTPTVTEGRAAGFQVTDEFISQLPQQLIIPNSHLQISKSIGQGEFGVVYRAKLLRKQGRSESGFVAVKTMRGLFTPNDVQSMMDEVLKMQSFNHPHVMTLIGVCLDAGPGLALVMPYMANGSLLAYLKEERPNLDLTDDAEFDTIFSVRRLLLRMCHQIVLGMDYLAQQKFVHRDLAARNCMLDISGNVKVSDFGLAEDVYTRGYFKQSKDGSDNVRLPYRWIPPESFQDGVFSEKSDVWAFGVTCWEVFMTGKIPYPAVDPMSLLKMLEGGQRLEKPPNAACSAEVYSIMRRCWRADPAQRPTFSELASILDRFLQLVADYTELTMTLPASEAEPEYEDVEITAPEGGEPLSSEIPVERNPVYGADDGVVILKNPAYSLPTGLQPASVSQPLPVAPDREGQLKNDEPVHAV